MQPLVLYILLGIIWETKFLHHSEIISKKQTPWALRHLNPVLLQLVGGKQKRFGYIGTG